MRIIKYLPAHESVLSWGIRTTTVGMQVVPPGAQYPYGEHPQVYMFSSRTGRILSNEIHILYLLNGRGWFQAAHCPKTRIQAGDAVIIFPNEWHNYAPDEKTGWEEAWVGFSGDFVQRIIREQYFDITYPIIHTGIKETIYTSIEKACAIAQAEKPAYQQQLAGYVFLTVSSIYAYSKQAPYKDSSDAERLSLAQKYMREHTSERLSMEEVAAQVGMGYAKFRKQFRNYTDFSPHQYFLNLKLEESKTLLLRTKYTSKQIASRMGFDSPSHFNRIFTQRYHQTPIQFRKSGNSLSLPKEKS